MFSKYFYDFVDAIHEHFSCIHYFNRIEVIEKHDHRTGEDYKIEFFRCRECGKIERDKTIL